jgi:hypothetical protein
MAQDLKKGTDEIKSKIRSYQTTSEVIQNSKLLKKASEVGDNFETKKSETSKKLNDFNDKIGKIESDIKNQYEELIDIFKLTTSNHTSKIKEKLDPDSQSRFNSKNNSLDFLLRQVLLASKNTKSRISEILTEEVIKTVGCSEEHSFDPNQNIYINLKQIDLTKLLVNDPNEGLNSVLYESYQTSNGEIPFAMDRELYNRTQNEGISFSDEYGLGYIGASGQQILDFKYVTSYTQNGITENGDFLEIKLLNRNGENNLSDFLRDYYKSISILEFDTLGPKVMNMMTNFIDISLSTSTSDKTEQSKFELILQRILGLCFDENREIDVSGNAKLSDLDVLDQSFFEVGPIELRNIEYEVNKFSEGVIEFESCDNIKFPIDNNLISEKMLKLRDLPENEKIDFFMDSVSSLSNDERWKSKIPNGVDINISINEGILKIIPRAVMTILSPKVLLGLMSGLASVGSNVINFIEDFKTFTDNMKKFLVNLVSKVGAIFVEELFKLIKKNLRKLVEVLMLEILRESKNTQIKIITTITYALLQLVNLTKDWRECKSIVDELLNLLNLGVALISPKIPLFALAGTPLLPGFSPTRAMAGILEKFQKSGIPTGDTPSGEPNLFVESIFETVKGYHEEFITNSKTEIFIPPLAVAALGAGTTLPGRGYGKTY